MIIQQSLYTVYPTLFIYAPSRRTRSFKPDEEEITKNIRPLFFGEPLF